MTPKSVDRTASVSAYVYQVIDNDALLLGETTEINCDWDKGQFEDGFDGYWLSLPDGQNLSISVVAITDEYTVRRQTSDSNSTPKIIRSLLKVHGTVSMTAALQLSLLSRSTQAIRSFLFTLQYLL